MKYSLYPIFLSLILLPTLCISCSEDNEMTSKEFEARRIRAHVHTVYQDTLQKTASGTYYYTLKRGTGRQMPDTGYVFAHQNRYSIDYNLEATSYEDVSRQLGVFSYSNYYGPMMCFVGMHTNLYGLEENIAQMRVGEKRRIILPSYLSGYVIDNNFQHTNPTVYDIEIMDVVEDIEKYELDTIESYRKIHYPSLDSLRYGFYRKTLVEGTGDTVKAGTTVKCWYVGKFLDGHVFDTNIADTATKYFINSGSTYEALSIAIPELEEDGSFASSNSESNYVDGFYYGLMGMREGETAIVFFKSSYGYGSDGNGSSSSTFYLGKSLPAYMPLVFWLQVLEEE